MRFAILAVAILIALHGCTGTQVSNSTVNSTNQTDGGPTQQLCQSGGGHWDTQGVCCRNLPPGKPCNMFCVAVCDCGGIAGFSCPAGYACTDYYPNSSTPDAMGICVKATQ